MEVRRICAEYPKNESARKIPRRIPPLAPVRDMRWGILHSMRLTLAHVGSKDEYDSQVQNYLERSAPLLQCGTQAFRSEEALLGWIGRQRGRVPVVAVLLDSRGRQMSSEVFARWLGARRDEGTQQIVFAIGPADGWTEAGRGRAQLQLSLGPMTMAHGLARLVMAEQLYRAVTILSGHPYHGGH